MLKTTIVTKPFIVVWIPDSLYIFLESKVNFDKQVKCGVYDNKPIEIKEFDTFKKADEFVDELWKI